MLRVQGTGTNWQTLHCDNNYEQWQHGCANDTLPVGDWFLFIH